MSTRRLNRVETPETRLLATPQGARGRPRVIATPATPSSATPSPEGDHAALLRSFNGRDGGQNSGTALRALQRDSADDVALSLTPGPVEPPSQATQAEVAGGACSDAQAAALKKSAPAPGDEPYEPLMGTPLRRPKSYGSLAPQEESPPEAEDDQCCPTCLEEFSAENPQIVLQCGHLFHLSCIYEWAERSEVCPVCGAQMVFEEQA